MDDGDGKGGTVARYFKWNGVLQWLVQDLTLERGSAIHWRHQLRGSLQDPIHHSLVPTEQHRSFGGGLCDLKASRKLELHSQVCDRRLQGLLEATNDLNVEETLNMMSSLKFISKTKPRNNKQYICWFMQASIIYRN